MNETSAEALILAVNALGAGILLFIAGVIQKIMNGMDEPEFKAFLNALDGAAMTNAVLVTVMTLPLIGAAFYLYAFCFHHWWFTAGFVMWVAGSSVTKITNLPVYKWVGDPSNTDRGELRRQRSKLQLGNDLRAWLTLLSVLLMACQFGAREVAIVLAVSCVLAVPLVWLGRRYGGS